jgi:hypothetical protein
MAGTLAIAAGTQNATTYSRKLATVGWAAGETIGTSQTSTAQKRDPQQQDATAVLASAGTLTAAEMPETVSTLTSYEFSWKFAKSSEWRNFVKKRKNRPFLSDIFKSGRKILDYQKSIVFR